MPDLRRRDVVLAVLTATAYVAARVIAFAGVGPLVEGDSPDYDRIAGISLFDPHFFGAGKPWALPLLYKLLPSDGLRVAGQLAISIVAWLVLAGVLARLVRTRWARGVAVVLVLAFSLTWPVIWWDPVLLAESLSISLAVLLLAALLAFAARPTRGGLGLTVAAALLLAATHDTNAFLVVLLLIPAGVAVALRARGLGIAVVVAALAIFAVSQISFRAGDRWEVPGINVVGIVVLPDRATTEYFRHRGMPVTPALREYTGMIGAPFVKAVRERPELASFRGWLNSHGQRTYIGWLATDLPGASRDVWDNRGRLFGRDVMATSAHRPGVVDPEISDDGVRRLLPGFVDRALYADTRFGHIAWLLIFAALVGLAASRRCARIHWVAPLAVLAAVPFLAFAVWHGDPLEPERHALLIGVLPRLSAIVLAVFAADALGTRQRIRAGRPGA
jgi:hypothetical protein